MHIHMLTCNLTLVSKLTKDLGNIKFDPNTCLFLIRNQIGQLDVLEKGADYNI